MLKVKIHQQFIANVQDKDIFVNNAENDHKDSQVYCNNLGTLAPFRSSNCWNYNDIESDEELGSYFGQKGCDHQECQRAVCNCDDYCCNVSWDILCSSSDKCSADVLCCGKQAFRVMDNYESGEISLLEKSLLTSQGLYFTTFAFNPIISPSGDCLEVYKGLIFMAWYRGGMDDRHVILSRSKIGSNKWNHIEFPHQHIGFRGDPTIGGESL